MFSKPAQQSGSASSGAASYSQQGHGFGTAPVFLTSICTILGAILFLRFGYAVGHVGLWGSLAIIALGHLVTIPTVSGGLRDRNEPPRGRRRRILHCQPLLWSKHRWHNRDHPLPFPSNLDRLLYGCVCRSLGTYF